MAEYLNSKVNQMINNRKTNKLTFILLELCIGVILSLYKKWRQQCISSKTQYIPPSLIRWARKDVLNYYEIHLYMHVNYTHLSLKKKLHIRIFFKILNCSKNPYPHHTQERQ